jgi:hypothetical protein
MAARTTRKMSDRHEDDLVAILGGERTRNSGAVWSDQADVHQTGLDQHYRFTMDGKSTLGKGITITREMIAKLREQSRGLDPLLPLRWYLDDRLTMVDEDWVALDLETFQAMLADANKYRRMKDVGCAQGVHDFQRLVDPETGLRATVGNCRGCELAPYEIEDGA